MLPSARTPFAPRNLWPVALLLMAFPAIASAATWKTTFELAEPVANSFGIVRVEFVWSTPRTEGVVNASDIVSLTERYYAWADFSDQNASIAKRSDGQVLSVVYEVQSIRDGSVVDDARMVTGPKFSFDLDSETMTDWGWSNFAGTEGTLHVFQKGILGEPFVWTRGSTFEFEEEVLVDSFSQRLVVSNYGGLNTVQTDIAQNEVWAQCLTVPARFLVDEIFLASRFGSSFQNDLIAQVFLGGAQGPSTFLDSLDIPAGPLEPFGTGFEPLALTPYKEWCFVFGRNALSGGGLELLHTDKDKPRSEGPAFLTSVYRSTGSGWELQSPSLRLKLELHGVLDDEEVIVVDEIRSDLDSSGVLLEGTLQILENVTNRAGLGSDGLHDATSGHYLGSPTPATEFPTLTLILERRSTIGAIDIWNYNVADKTGLGITGIEILHSDTGVSWTSVGTYAVAQALGSDGAPAERIRVPEFDAGLVQLVTSGGTGLAEVELLPEPSQPVTAVVIACVLALVARRRRGDLD